MPDTSIINIAGIDILDERKKQVFNRLLNEYYPRIFRQIKNITIFEGKIKAYEKVAPSKKTGDTSKKRKKGIFVKKGKDKKYSFSLKVVSPAGVFKADYADWDFTRVIHKVLNKMMNEIEGKLHSSDKYEKVRKRQMKRERDDLGRGFLMRDLGY